MFTFEKKQQKGFTLIELMVVVGIIIILLSIIFASVSQARQNTREKKRVADLANIELALTLYKEDYTNRVDGRTYPSYPNGVEVGVGGAIDTVIREYNGNVYRDPNSDGVSGGNEYWYDSDFICSSPNQVVLFVRSMEQSKNANFNTLCTANNRSTAIAGASSYIVVLKQ